MSRKIRTQVIVAFAAIALLLSAALPAEAISMQRDRTVVAKDRMGKRAEVGTVGSDAIASDHVKVQLMVKSRTVTHVDMISITYSCGEADDTKIKSKWFAPEGGVELPRRVGLKLPADSEGCFVVGAVSAAMDREGPIALKLVALSRR